MSYAHYKDLDKWQSQISDRVTVGIEHFTLALAVIIDFAEVIDYNNVCDYL
jgi:hypothetical protein